MIKPNESIQSGHILPSIADRIRSTGLSPLAKDVDSLTTILNQHWLCLPSEAREQLLAAFSRIEGQFLQSWVVLDGMITQADIGDAIDLLLTDDEEKLDMAPLPGYEIITVLEQAGLLNVEHVLTDTFYAVSHSMEAYEIGLYVQKSLKKQLLPVLKCASEQGLLPNTDAEASDFDMD